MKSNAAGSDAALAPLIDKAEPLSPDTEVTAAIAALRGCGLPALPLVSEGRLVGLVSERALLPLLARLDRGEAVAVRDAVRGAVTLPVTTPPAEVLCLLSRDEVELLTVVDLDGAYLGVVTRRRLIDALEAARRPRLVGGMATPLGVHLTSIDHRGGAGDFALVLTGAMMAVLLALSRGLVAVGLGLVSGDPQQALLSELAGPLVALGAVPAPGLLSGALVTLVFFSLVRCSPLAGYHSGEHQTVHALERGLPLVAEQVAAMPRAHPRCGSNFVVLLLQVVYLAAALWDRQPWYVSGPLAASLLFWRVLGRAAQAWFTTRPPSRRQLESGINAARMLLSRHQRQPGYRAGRLRRLWNRGLPQVLLGMTLTWIGLAGAGRLLSWMAVRFTV